MVSWSCLKQPLQLTFQNQKFLQSSFKRNVLLNKIQLRKMAGGHDDHYHLELNTSRFHWKKFKDMLHFYVMLGLIPMTALIMYANIFIGPAQLTELPPDDAEPPQYWEYHKNPISRFISRYMHHSPQQDYEKYLHFIYEENEKRLIRNLELKIRAMMTERHDYQVWSYRPVLGKYLRVSKEAADELENLRGTN